MSPLVEQVVGAVLRGAAQSAFAECAVKHCGKRAPGLACSDCHRPVCLDHALAALEFPPRVVCMRCVAQVWREERAEHKEKSA